MPDHKQDSETTGTPIGRRDFLGASARTLMLGGLGAYFVQQHLRAQRLLNDPNCIRLETCSDCIEFGGCTLPKSHVHREQLESERNASANRRT